MVVHHFLTMVFVAYIALNTRMYATRSHRTIEIGSELLLHCISIILSQYNVKNYNAEAFEVIENISFAFFGLLFLINIIIAIKFSVEGCKEKKKKKMLVKKRAELIKKRDRKRDKKRSKAALLKNSMCD